MATSQEIIQIQNLQFTYNQKQFPALSNINLTIDEGEFILLAGPSGSGKSTLVRLLNGLIPHFYGGTIQGNVHIDNQDIFTHSTRQLAQSVGMVFQSADNQLLMNTVESEIAFGLENLAIPIDEIEVRITEILEKIHITQFRDRKINTLSGGEKQKVAIASVLAMLPKVLVLDEPTAELDPFSAIDLLDLISNLNQQLHLTIILIEHRIDRVLPYLSRIILLKNGQIQADGRPRDVLSHPLEIYDLITPTVVRLAKDLLKKDLNLDQLPLSFEEAQSLLNERISSIIEGNSAQNRLNAFNPIQNSLNYFQKYETQPILIEFQHVGYQYQKEVWAVKDINFQAHAGEFIAIIGKNGSGKSTLLKLINGLLHPTEGQVLHKNLNIKTHSIAELAKRIGFIFQNPSLQFYAETLEEDMIFFMKNMKISRSQMSPLIEDGLSKFGLTQYRHVYSRYLSVGEQQKAALALILTSQPQILILDEPTHGMDPQQKQFIFEFLNIYRNNGRLVILATHDIDSVAQFADRIILLEDGSIKADNIAEIVLTENSDFSPSITSYLRKIPSLSSTSILTLSQLMEVLNDEKK
jgi:energy-coupling factor transport system ATP-binding protein